MTNGGSFESFEHTADLGLHIHGSGLYGLLETACGALCAQLTDLETVRPLERLEISLEEEREDELLRRWLAELLNLFNERRWLACEAHVEKLENCALVAEVRGESYDPGRHEIKAELKAVTWHMLAVAETGGGMLRGTVVFDT